MFLYDEFTAANAIFIVYEMNAPQNQQPTVIDSMDGTLTEWYNACDEAFRLSEVIPGQYEYTITNSYGTQCPVSEGGMTNIDVSCERFYCISLDNSYIYVEQTIPVNFPALAAAGYTGNGDWVYFGYKSAFDSLDQYRIYSNGDLVQTQNNANFESFILYNLLTDQAKENSDLFATSKKIRERNPNVPGVYISTKNWSTVGIKNIKLKFRIPLPMFLLFANMKWQPGWMGKFTFELYFTYKNAVTYVVPADESEKGFWSESFCNPFGFQQINSRLMKYTAAKLPNPAASSEDEKAGSVDKIEYYDAAFKCTTSTLTKCRLYLAQYMLTIDVYNALSAKYIQYPLLFPIQTVQWKNFTKELHADPNFNCAESLTLTHCDTMYIIFRKDINSRTCFENPEISFQINIDGKFYPREMYNTVEDPRFTNMMYDALNLNNSALLSIPTDLRTSLQPYVKINSYAGGNPEPSTEYHYSTIDRSNFFIAIPFSTDEDFMGGISSGSTCQVELTGQRLNKRNALLKLHPSESRDPHARFDWTLPPTGIYFEDAILKIRSVKPPGAPQVQITNATIEQIIASNRA